MENEKPHTMDNQLIKSAEEFIGRNTIPVAEGRMCGDGRYTQSHGRLARFGGDGGYILALLFLNHEYDLGQKPEDIVNAIYEISIQDGGKFYAHTDDHADESDPYSIGCGHLGKAALAEYEEAYKVNPQDVKDSIKRIKELEQQDPDHVEITKLTGSHKERAVIFNESEDTKIEHSDGNTQYFVVDTSRDKNYVAKIWTKIIEEIPALEQANITREIFEDGLTQQTLATARILAPKYPILRVNFSESTSSVEQIGEVA